jgi:fatty-acyl-CoA synthase
LLAAMNAAVSTTTIHDFRHQRSWSGAEFAALTGGVAARLQSQMSEPRGARVAGLSRNGIELLALMFACFRIGAVFVPLNWRLNPRELAELLADSGASLVYAQAEFAPLLAGSTVPQHSLDAILDAPAAEVLVSNAAMTPAPPAGPDDQLAMLLYTSGTSGRPKGVMLTLGNLRVASENFRRVADVRPESGLLCDAPMFHTIGLVAICHTSVIVGARLLLSPAFVAADTVDRIGDERLGISHYFTVPQVAQQMLQAPNFSAEKFRRLRALFLGGAPLSRELIENWSQHGVTVINGYGSSEAGTCIHMPLDNSLAQQRKHGSIGLPVPHMEVSLHDANGALVADGEVGEIWLRGPSITQGYWRLEAETRQAFSNGWFRTGDAAYRDADGFYFLVDRWKDMYISGGENVYPAEVEQVIAKLTGVAEVAVVGMPDPQWGEIGVAFIVMAPGAALTAEEVIRHVRANLATYKAPRRVEFVVSLPRTGSGKVRKSELRAGRS